MCIANNWLLTEHVFLLGLCTNYTLKRNTEVQSCQTRAARIILATWLAVYSYTGQTGFSTEATCMVCGGTLWKGGIINFYEHVHLATRQTTQGFVLPPPPSNTHRFLFHPQLEIYILMQLFLYNGLMVWNRLPPEYTCKCTKRLYLALRYLKFYKGKYDHNKFVKCATCSPVLLFLTGWQREYLL